MSFLGLTSYYRKFVKGYADKIYPMQQLMRNKCKKFTLNDEGQVSFENIKREVCQAPVLGVTTEKSMFVSDTDALVVAISVILHQEQAWNEKTVLRLKAYVSKAFSDIRHEINTNEIRRAEGEKVRGDHVRGKI